jgi:fumarate hydratase class II
MTTTAHAASSGKSNFRSLNDKASAIAHKANDDGLTLKAAAVASGYVDQKRVRRNRRS